MASIDIRAGDCRDVIKTIADNSIDSVVTDPPYALVSIAKRFGKSGSAPAKGDVYRRVSAGFMSVQWDNGQTAFDPDFWAEALRVLKPGGHIIAFGGTRTFHRLACAIEDAGFEIRDTIAWLYGSGYPKSHNVAKGIDKAAGRELEIVPRGAPVKRMIPGADQAKRGWEKKNGREYQPGDYVPSEEAAPWAGWGTALKPALEPICLARKPLYGTVAANVLEHGTGALNIDECRVPTDDKINQPSTKGTLGGANGWDRPWKSDEGAVSARDRRAREAIARTEEMGRWPANVVHDASDEVVAAFPQSEGQQADASSSSSSRKNQNVYGSMKRGNGRDREASGDRRYTDDGSTNFAALPGARRGDTGSAARFFYSAKADKGDRLESKHPTVKPVDLMRWLVRLVTPKGGLVLDPFAGSGTTGMACMAEGFDAILVEREAQYLEDIRRRIAHVRGEDTPLFGSAAE